MASSLIRRFALSIRKLGVGMDVPVLCFCLSLHISCCMLHYYFFSYVVYSSYLYEYSAVYSIHWSMPQRSFPISSLFRINQSHYSISDPQNSLSQKPCTRDISQSDMHQKSKHHKTTILYIQLSNSQQGKPPRPKQSPPKIHTPTAHLH